MANPQIWGIKLKCTFKKKWKSEMKKEKDYGYRFDSTATATQADSILWYDTHQ